MAFKTNALIIPACGFDSIPPDIAVFVANRYVKAVLGPSTSIEDSTTAYDVEGGFPGGSTDSIMSFVEDVPRKTLIRSAADYVLRHREWSVRSRSSGVDISALLAHGLPSRPPKIVYKLPYDSSTSWYGTIWPQRMINRQTVHHSWSLFERNKDAHPAAAYGSEFRYDECLRTPGPISALFVGFSICLFVLALLISPVRWLLPCSLWLDDSPIETRCVGC